LHWNVLCYITLLLKIVILKFCDKCENCFLRQNFIINKMWENLFCSNSTVFKNIVIYISYSKIIIKWVQELIKTEDKCTYVEGFRRNSVTYA
jgi:hypothetical protein